MINNTNEIVSDEVCAKINSSIDFSGKDISHCWVWIGCLFSTGYGCFTSNGRNVGAHRVVWEMHNGQKIPDGLLIRHSCDNPACCNPYHLSIGTVQDNSNDMMSRNRQAMCQKHGMAKISDGDAKDIADSEESYSVLALRYGLSKASISMIKTGRSWQGLNLQNTKEARSREKLNADSARAVFLAPGMQRDIAERFGITQKQVSYIKSGRAWGKATADLRGK